jgi:hypothetical protein
MENATGINFLSPVYFGGGIRAADSCQIQGALYSKIACAVWGMKF